MISFTSICASNRKLLSKSRNSWRKAMNTSTSMRRGSSKTSISKRSNSLTRVHKIEL